MNKDTLPSHHNDEETVALYHFDEGSGNEAHSACGDPALTLRAKQASWTERPGGWIFSLANHDPLFESGDEKGADYNALEEYGVAPSARFMGSLAGRDPQHDTAGMMYPRDDRPGTLYAGWAGAIFFGQIGEIRVSDVRRYSH
ncbi:MAG: hypothetical protein ACLFWL_15685 [Candidatus Brocadiia bacterium]